MLKCSRCKKWKEESEFNKNRSKENGFQSDCNPCRKIVSLSYYPRMYQEKKEELKKKSKNYTVERKEKVINAYGGKCACCGEDKTEFLCIDHINGGGSKERRSGLKGTAFYQHLIKNNFPEGYRVLCHNCNFSLGIYGFCPHKK